MDAGTADAYLERIDASRNDDIGALQWAHLTAVPFENLDIHLGAPIKLDEDALVDKVVHRRRGGFCYELNGLFATLLGALGYDVTLLAARVHGGAGLGPPFDHLALVVGGDERLLVDVGFGRLTSWPLRFDDRGEQHDRSGRCRLVDTDGGDVDVLIDDVPQYRIERRARQLSDFVPTCWWQQTSPESHFTSGPVCSISSDRGLVTLRADSLVSTRDGMRTESRLESDAAILDAYRELFGIELTEVPRRSRTTSLR